MRDEEYRAELEYLCKQGRQETDSEIIRSRAEIVGHARAFRYIVDCLVTNGQKLSKEILLATYKLLMDGTDEADIGGSYRTSAEAASHGLRWETDDEYQRRTREILKLKPNRATPERLQIPEYFSKFPRPASVPLMMEELIQMYNEDQVIVAKEGVVDPCEMAARYHDHLVNIHPFVDGNGRMCRMLQNAVLIKYHGTCVVMGADPNERKPYIRQRCEAAKVFTKEGYLEIPMRSRSSHEGLASLIVNKMSLRLKGLRGILEDS